MRIVAALLDRRGGGEVEHGDVGLEAFGECADLFVQMQAAGRAGGGKPHQLRRMGGGAAQLADLIGRSHCAQHRERRPAAGVCRQTDRDAPRRDLRHVEQT